MRLHPLAVVLLLASGVSACAARAAAPVAEPALPDMNPPPAPPRVVAIYVEPVELEPIEAAPPAEPVSPRPQPRVTPPAPAPEEPAAPQGPPPPPPALTLTPIPGSEAKTEASIRALLGRASRDLDRVNGGALSPDGRTQFEAARRFVQQAEEALKARNLVYAGKLADKAAVMAAVLVR